MDLINWFDSVGKVTGAAVGVVGVVGLLWKPLKGWIARRSANLSVTLIRKNHNTQAVRIFNEGPAPAKNVKVTFPDKEPIFETVESAPPIALINPNLADHIPYVQYLEHHTKSLYFVELHWDDWRPGRRKLVQVEGH